MHAHMCILIEAYYNAKASNLKKKKRKGKRSPNLFSFVQVEGAPVEQQKRGKDKAILG